MSRSKSQSKWSKKVSKILEINSYIALQGNMLCIAENVIQKLVAHETAGSTLVSALVECVNHTEIAGRFSKEDARDNMLNQGI